MEHLGPEVNGSQRGAFWEMVCESGDREALEERIDVGSPDFLQIARLEEM